MGAESSTYGKKIQEFYKFVRTADSPIGELRLYTDKASPLNSVYCKIIKEEDSKILVDIDNTKKFLYTAHNVIRVLAHEQVDSLMPMCGAELTKVYIDTFDIDLHEAILKKRRANGYFSEMEIWNTFIDIIKALGSYNGANRGHGYICPRAIVLRGKKSLLLDGHFFSLTHYILAQMTDKTHYAAPELYNQYFCGDFDLVNVDIFKCDIFSFG